ncbi:c-type cytochrome [Cellulophaga sp. L1A9]|uniref:c-type cytochrome n=1 Tax=Cellulophaga sp. L1A9 TaxID=2686362 RepID=UPI00131CB995|nr:c-type cytochrome [Cellulophaga sp. L1A9]
MKLKKIFLIVVSVTLVILVFYPNRLNRYVRRTFRVYATTPKGELAGVQFQKITLDDRVKGQYTSLVMGPDHKLYASAINGEIKRFIILPSGELVLEQTFKPYGNASKFTIGLAFDPAATSDSLIVWTTFSETPSSWVVFPDIQEPVSTKNWAGCMARMQLSSSSAQVIKNDLVLKDLPRFGPNHENFANSIVFGPDGKLYFGQGANTGMGWCDCEPNQEPTREALLSATILCLDLGKLPKKLPLSVKTLDGGGNYDPYTAMAPLKIYATGVRNGYDLVWHSNGQLYTTINGSGGNENTPTSDPESSYYIPPNATIQYTGPKNIPAVIGAQPDQNDFLARVVEGGYYGHPNPLRAEYVLNDGDAALDNSEYNGVKADANFKGFTYDFGPHVAPTGIAEYKSNSFNGRLKGCLIVARMVHNDLVFLRPGGKENDIAQDYDGLKMGLGLEGEPLDVLEDTATGNIYVSGFSNKTITLFRPTEWKPERLAHYSKNEPKKKINSLWGGKAIYENNCQMCHGAIGQGAIGPSLIDEEWINGKENIIQTIENGSGHGSMPAWKIKLSSNDTKWVVRYILSLEKKEKKVK